MVGGKTTLVLVITLACTASLRPALGGEVRIEPASTAAAVPRGAGWDVEANEVLLRTEGGAGDVVAIPAVGQEVFFHLRFRVVGPAADADVSLEPSAV